jgi:hypothetical protein
MTPKELENTIDRARAEKWSALTIYPEDINYLTVSARISGSLMYWTNEFTRIDRSTKKS